MAAEVEDGRLTQWRQHANDRFSVIWRWARANPTTAYGASITVVAVLKLAAVANFDPSVAYTILRNDSLVTIGGLALGAIVGVLLLSTLIGVGNRVGSRIGRSDRAAGIVISSSLVACLLLVLPLFTIVGSYECTDEDCSPVSSTPLIATSPYLLLLYLFLFTYVGSAWINRRAAFEDPLEDSDDPASDKDARSGPMHNPHKPLLSWLFAILCYAIAVGVMAVFLWSWLPDPWYQRETLEMRDGERLDGYVLEDAGRWITFLTEEARSIRQIDIDEVLARE